MNWQTVLHYLHDEASARPVKFSGMADPELLGTWVCGMANVGGGLIFVGLNRSNLHLVGTELNRQWLADFGRANFPGLRLDATEISKNEKVVLEIGVGPALERPIRFKSKAYVWEGDNVRLADSVEISVMTEASVAKARMARIEEDLVALISEVEPSMAGLPLIMPPVDPTVINDRQRQILDFLKTNHSIKNKEYRTQFGISHKTAHLELVDLVGKGLISTRGAGRSTCYILTPG